MQYIDWLEPVVEIATGAGEKILEIYNSDFDVEHKADESPLTAADLAAHKHIEKHLNALTPNIPVLSEESASIAWETRKHWDPYWLVDPLDGTKEFVKRNGEFTVNIALIHQHRPVLGVVYVPVTNVTYCGDINAGAQIIENGQRSNISVRSCASTPVVVGSRSHRGELLDNYLARLGPHEMTPMGSSLKICLVAAGKADLYPRLGPTSEWDTAAAHAVVSAAGGTVVDLNGNEVTYNAKENILNPHFFVIGDSSIDWLKHLTSAD
ncbi:MAG: 3'(2'),5'-bisphosphate nucleotidase CysQ [Gammaproteobacteria bacterium]